MHGKFMTIDRQALGEMNACQGFTPSKRKFGTAHSRTLKVETTLFTTKPPFAYFMTSSSHIVCSNRGFTPQKTTHKEGSLSTSTR